MSWFPSWSFSGAALILTFGFSACGKDDKKNDTVGKADACDLSAAGKGCVAKVKNGKIELTFSDAESGAEFVVMPYALGDPATVSGSTPDRGIEFAFSKSGGGAVSLRQWQPRQVLDPQKEALQSAMARDHDLRTLANHFDPDRGANQGEWFWSLANKLDAVSKDRGFLAAGSSHTGPMEGSVTTFYRASTKPTYASRRRGTGPGTANSESLINRNSHHVLPTSSELAHRGAALTKGGTCPTDKVVIPGKTAGSTLTDDIPPNAVVSGTDYCIVYLSTPVTESSKAAIEDSIKTLLSTYKTTIYKDQFAAVDAFTFKPVYVIVDIADKDLWPQVDALNLAGAFLPSTAKVQKMPAIYMPSDYKKVRSFASSSDDAFLKRQFHAVLAHETQHAIMDYFKRVVPKVPDDEDAGELITIDEGLAHYMEDVFGYGDDAFDLWGKTFLQTAFVTPALPGALDYSTHVSAEVARAAAHSFMYYLASQKGGVTYEGGKVTGGGGLDYVAAVVKETAANGAKNLAAKFGGAWADTLGDYFGALAIDNVTLAGSTDAVFTAGVPITTVTDLQGTANRTYGMRFNNYKDLTTHADDYAKAETTTKVDGLGFYMTSPVLYKLADVKDTLTLTPSAEIPNTAATVVRIK